MTAHIKLRGSKWLSLSEFVADVEAANDFVLMARRWWPAFDSFRVFPFKVRNTEGSIPTC